MAYPLHGRSFLRELDFTPEEWRGLLNLAAELKAAKKEGRGPAPQGQEHRPDLRKDLHSYPLLL